jgi:hypothetical protein
VPNELVPRLQQDIETWHGVAALVRGLQKPDMQDRHWQRVMEVLKWEEAPGRDAQVELVLSSGMLDVKSRCARPT